MDLGSGALRSVRTAPRLRFSAWWLPRGDSTAVLGYAEGMDLQTFKKLPLGGVDRRSLVSALSEHGRAAAESLLETNRAVVKSAGTSIHPDDVVLVLGGSNGITRALLVQLLFGEKAAIHAVHFDSEKMQIGAHHVQVLSEAAGAQGLKARFWNADAMRPQTIEEVVAEMKGRFRTVHLINGIAAGATKRYEKYGTAQVRDIDVAFHPVLQVPDFTDPANIRQVGMVDVDIATEADIERTNKYMGTSSLVWAEALGAEGLLGKDSIVAFCDYDFEHDDPVYAMGPLAGAKQLQRESMAQIRERFGARTARLNYPAMATTAIGAIPGGLMMFALTCQILRERGQYQDLMTLAHHSMDMFKSSWDGQDLPLDKDYQVVLPEFHRRKAAMTPGDLPEAFRLVYGMTPGT